MFALALLLAMAAQAEVAPVFAPIVAQLREHTAIPVRLPATLPDLGQGRDPIYAVVEYARKSRYSVILAFTPDCNGASVCRIGTMRARRLPKPEPARGKRVRLAGGVSGMYREASCGANCSDSVITWREGNVEYSAGVKAGSEKDVVNLANAILNGKS